MKHRKGKALRRRYGRAKYGPMTPAEHARSREAVKRYSTTRHSIDRQGYDQRGRYYGIGAPLWDVWDSTEDVYYEIRAPDARTARQGVIANPNKWRARR